MPKDLLIRENAQDSREKWIVKVANNLLENVHYWRSFYDEFDIRVNYIPEEGTAKNIAQAIAFDIVKGKRGVLIGKQRSEYSLPFSSYIGHHPKHIFFTWNRRTCSYLRDSYESIERLVVTGYPNSLLRRQEHDRGHSFSQTLKYRGANFIVALFDNMYGADIHFSTEDMVRFYKLILQWVLEDPTLGVVIKSKKSYAIDNLLPVHPLLNDALNTGRAIRIEDEWGRLPSDASVGADIAVGCGISSAVIEAVIAGCRGIHYDMTCLRGHEFYKWGYEQIIFDDLERMVLCMKRYKEDPESHPSLGDWSAYIDRLDHFRDDKGGKRMGVYIRWLIEGFEMGKDKDDAVQYADRLYREKWGEDKVIDCRG